MAQLAPPELPPPVHLGDDGRLPHLRLRLLQVCCTILTVLITTWLITLGPVPAILGLVIAKHVLVAILVMGLGVDSPQTASR